MEKYDTERIARLEEDISNALEAWEFAKKDTEKAIQWEERRRQYVVELSNELKKLKDNG
jgi:hypothetical protein